MIILEDKVSLVQSWIYSTFIVIVILKREGTNTYDVHSGRVTHDRAPTINKKKEYSK